MPRSTGFGDALMVQTGALRGAGAATYRQVEVDQLNLDLPVEGARSVKGVLGHGSALIS